MWSEFEWTEIKNSKSGIAITDIKITRFNKTTFSLSGPVELTDDLKDDAYDVVIAPNILRFTCVYTFCIYRLN